MMDVTRQLDTARAELRGLRQTQTVITDENCSAVLPAISLNPVLRALAERVVSGCVTEIGAWADQNSHILPSIEEVDETDSNSVVRGDQTGRDIKLLSFSSSTPVVNSVPQDFTDFVTQPVSHIPNSRNEIPMVRLESNGKTARFGFPSFNFSGKHLVNLFL